MLGLTIEIKYMDSMVDRGTIEGNRVIERWFTVHVVLGRV
jgi:hypothetical protein